jgi:hypothetical protein
VFRLCLVHTKKSTERSSSGSLGLEGIHAIFLKSCDKFCMKESVSLDRPLKLRRMALLHSPLTL